MRTKTPKNQTSNHRKPRRHIEPTDPEFAVTAEWPWRVDPDNDWWSRKRIRGFLCRWSDKMGIDRPPGFHQALDHLTLCERRLRMATALIDKQGANAKFGRQSALAVERQEAEATAKVLRDLRAFDFAKPDGPDGKTPKKHPFAIND